LKLAPAVSVEIFVAGCATDYPAVKQRKVELIKARVSTSMKRGIDDLAIQRGESEAVIIREALNEYLKKSAIRIDGSQARRRKKRN
jgi:Ribbon-helix-helix protein, copG family